MRKHLKSRGRPYTYEKNTSTATSFPGTRVEKTWSGELGGDGKDIWEESEGASETEVCGQLTRMMD